MWRHRLVVAFAAIGAASGRAQSVQLRNAGPGSGPAFLSLALASPHTLIEPAAGPRVLRADSTWPNTVISLGRTVIVEGAVHGDVIVVNADLYVHPGGNVDGRAIAIGGGVYESALAHTAGAVAYRDATYDVAAVTGGFALTYRSLSGPPADTAVVSLPGIEGLQIPFYDRSNGLSLPIALVVTVPRVPIQIQPGVTYRSQLGRLDPSVVASVNPGGQTSARIAVSRGTFTNDAWIWSNLVNSIEYLLVGDDARNYYRATRAEATVSRNWSSTGWTLEPFVGARAERARSVRPDSSAESGPWAFLNRHDVDDVLRPNPPVEPATLYSVLAGAEWTGTSQDVVARARIDEELGTTATIAGVQPTLNGTGPSSGSHFAQTTLDAGIAFPTFGAQRLKVEGHAVLTLGSVPRERWAYLGGPGTIPTLGLLERGGDRLVYVDARYEIPVARVTLPLVGSPVVTLREALGGAGASGFPTLAQATGLRLSASVVYLEVMVDPVSHAVFKGLGISLAR
jgi:hypothetical protein